MALRLVPRFARGGGFRVTRVLAAVVHGPAAGVDDLLRHDHLAHPDGGLRPREHRHGVPTSPTRRATPSATSTCRRSTGVNRRRDLLQTYGPYPSPALLLEEHPAAHGRRSRPSTARRSPSRRTSSTSAETSSTPSTPVTRRSSTGSTTERPSSTPVRKPAGTRWCTTRAPDVDPNMQQGASFNESSFNPTKIDRANSGRLQDLHRERRPREHHSQRHLRLGQLPRHRVERASTSLCGNLTAQLTDGTTSRRASTSRTRRATARSSGAPSTRRRADRSTKAASSSRARPTRTTLAFPELLWP